MPLACPVCPSMSRGGIRYYNHFAAVCVRVCALYGFFRYFQGHYVFEKRFFCVKAGAWSCWSFRKSLAIPPYALGLIVAARTPTSDTLKKEKGRKWYFDGVMRVRACFFIVSEKSALFSPCVFLWSPKTPQNPFLWCRKTRVWWALKPFLFRSRVCFL